MEVSMKNLKTVFAAGSAMIALGLGATGAHAATATADATAEILQQENISSILLVTSAWHMRRAEAMFRMEGIALTPSATDYQIIHAPPVVPKWLPTVDDLQKTTYALREYIGFMVFALGKA